VSLQYIYNGRIREGCVSILDVVSGEGAQCNIIIKNKNKYQGFGESKGFWEKYKIISSI